MSSPLAALLLSGALFAPPLAPEVTADRLIIDKSERTLTVIWRGAALKTYRIALGAEPVGPKLAKGDGKTPEGVYSVSERNEKSIYHRALVLSYPNAQDEERSRAAGVHPGGEIEIHGLRDDLSWVGSAHVVFDWTDGCIALSDGEMDELWRAVPKGTPVEIRP